MSSRLDDGIADARVLVTGAAGGIGSAVVEAFLAAGAAVVASDVKPVSTDGGLRAAFGVDLRQAADCRQLVVDAADALGGLDVVAHTAGVLRRSAKLADVTEADWDLQHDVNLRASFFLLREAAELMSREGSGGRLVGVASQSWWTGGYGGSAVYAASKGGLVSLCRGLARTYGPAGITVNTIAPGAIDTPMLTADLGDDALRSVVDSTPLGRLGRPDEVADAVLFLASARAAFITGATLNVSGGWLVY
jgi:NAD(P)-dependent dehydrogenase (short-subunit alcohol dehydrogenase family)